MILVIMAKEVDHAKSTAVVKEDDKARHKILANKEEKTRTQVSRCKLASTNGRTWAERTNTSSIVAGNHTATTPNSQALPLWLDLSRWCTVSQSWLPVYEAAAPVSVPEVLTPTRRCAAATGGNGRSDGEARDEAGRSAVAEGW